MKNDDSLKRLKAMAEAIVKLQKKQDEEAARQAVAETDEVSWFFLRRHAEDDFGNDGKLTLEYQLANENSAFPLFGERQFIPN